MADPFIGEVRLMAFSFAPRGWYLCNGSLMPIATNTTLFSLVSTSYGGDGRTTFALPDLRARTPVSRGRHPGSYFDWRMGQFWGGMSHTLTLSETVSHTHTPTLNLTGGTPVVTINATQRPGSSIPPVAGSYLAKPHPSGGGGDYQEYIYNDNPSTSSLVALGGFEVSSGSSGSSSSVIPGEATVGTAGQQSTPVDIAQPAVALTYGLASVGIYPPRS